MQAHQLRPPLGSKHARKRSGRGNASGHGTYSGKGSKGQKARAGSKPRRFFEGGQTRLFKALPSRRGFTNFSRIEYSPVNLDDLNRFEAGAEVTPELLKERGVLRSVRKPVKVLASGEITKALTVRANRFSLAAKEKIEAAGGTVIETDERKDHEGKRERRAVRRAAKVVKGSKAKAASGKQEAEAEAEAPEAKTEAAEADTEEADVGDSE